MLQSMRENMKGAVAVFIVIFLGGIMALSLVDLSGSGGYDQDYGDVAVVNGNKISERELQIGLQQERQRLQGQFGSSLPPEFLSDDRLRAPVLQSLIQRSVVEDNAVNSGMTVSDKAIDQFIIEQPQFQSNGRFEPEQFIQQLRASGYTPAAYRAELKQSLVTDQQLNIFNSTSFVTQDELENLYGLSRQTRNFSWVSLPIADLPASIIVTPADIQKEYDVNKADYKTEEQVAIEFIELRVSDLVKEVAVSIEDIEQRFTQEVRIQSSIEREAAHIMVDADNEQADANIAAIQKQLADGSTSFEELAKTYSDDIASKEVGGNLGVSSGTVFPPAFESALENLAVGEVSEPITVDNATHFIKLVSITGGEEDKPLLADNKERIESELKIIEAEQLFVEKLAELNDLAYNADSLKEVAQQLNLPTGETALFSRNGGSDAVLSDGRVLNAAFSDQVLLERFSSQVLELAPDYAVVVKLTKHEPVRTETLEEKSELILDTLKIERAKEQLAEQAKTLQAALTEGKSLEDIATANNLVVNTENNITRENRNLNSELVDHAFTLSKPLSTDKPVTSSLYLVNNDYVLVSLNTVKNADYNSLNEEEKEGARLSLTQASAASEFRAWQTELVDGADVEILGAN